MRAWMMAAVAIVASPAMAADQFDLICKGIEGRTPVSARYHVDLAAKRWCRDACASGSNPIQEVTGEKIVFQLKERKFDRDFSIIHQVIRSTGVWTDFFSGVSSVDGICEPATFTAIPEQRAKF